MSIKRPEFKHSIAVNEYGFYCVPKAFMQRALPKVLMNGGFCEPAEMTFTAAQCTIELNKLNMVNLYNVAAGETEDTLPLRIARSKDQAEMAAAAKLVPDAVGEGLRQVPVKRIDDLVSESRHVSVLHLDVEGFEVQAVRGAQKMIERCRPMLVLEGGKRKPRMMYHAFLAEVFPGLEYTYFGSIENNSIFKSMA